MPGNLFPLHSVHVALCIAELSLRPLCPVFATPLPADAFSKPLSLFPRGTNSTGSKNAVAVACIEGQVPRLTHTCFLLHSRNLFCSRERVPHLLCLVVQDFPPGCLSLLALAAPNLVAIQAAFHQRSCRLLRLQVALL